MLESRWPICKRPEPMLRHLADKANARKLRLFACACCRRLWPWLSHDASRQAVELLERQADAASVRGEAEETRTLAEQGVRAAEASLETHRTAQQEAQSRRARTWESMWVGDPPAPSLLVRSAADAEAAGAAADAAEATLRAAQLVLAIAQDTRTSESIAQDAVQVVAMARSAAAAHARSARWMHRADEEADRPVPRSRAAVRAAQAAQWIERKEEAFQESGWRITERAEKVERRAQCALIRDLFGDPFHPVAIEPDWLSWNNACVVQMARAIYDERKYQDMSILADALQEAGCADPDVLNHCRQPGEHARGCWILDLLLGLT